MTKAQIMKEVWSRIGIYSFCYTFEPINSKGEEYLKLACPNRKFKDIEFRVSSSVFDEHKHNKEAIIYEIQRDINELFTDCGKHDLNVKIPTNMASKIFSGTINSIVDMYVAAKDDAESIVYGNQVLGIQVTGHFWVQRIFR